MWAFCFVSVDLGVFILGDYGCMYGLTGALRERRWLV